MSAPAYGYAHRARVMRLGEAEETYLVEVPDLAPGILSGPFTSAVRDLQPGDQVLVLQIGITGGDMAIVGRLPERPAPFTLPIEISDVDGLAEALDGRATDAELTALTGVVAANGAAITTLQGADTTQNGRLTALEATDLAYDGRLDSLEAADIALDGRLDTAEANIVTHTSAIAANGTSITTLSTWEHYQQSDFDIYGDVLSSFPRALVGNQATTPTGRILWWRTRLRRDATLSKIRVGYQSPGVGGTTTAAIFRSNTPTGAYTRQASVASAPVAGIKEYSFTPALFTRGEYVLVALLLTGQSTSLALAVQAGAVPAAAVTILNPASNNFVWGQVTATTMPTTIDPGDGTWGNTTITWWSAVA